MDVKSRFLTLLALVFVFQISFGQEKTISGVVSDDSGIPLPGVNVTVEGSTVGTQTDFDGNYSISVQEGAVLIFSFVGFEDQQITVGTATTVDVSMKEGSSLDEVIVTAFGRKVTKNESTGSVTTVSSDQLTKASPVNVTQSLEGNVPGLTIKSSSGNPGSAPEIQIRGQNSITASTSPLYVVDGIPLSIDNLSGRSNGTSLDPMSLIGAENVESISILKDASSVAPYGADGANGVILITTKSGRKNAKAVYNLNYTFGMNNTASKELTSMNAAHRLEAIEEGYWNRYGSGAFGDGTIASRDDLYDFVYNNEERVRTWEELGRPDTDWKKLVTNKNAPTHDISFSVSQGGEKSSFFASLNYNNSEATVIGSGFHRMGGNLRFNTDLNDKLKLTIIGNVTNAVQDINVNQSSAFANPNVSKHLNTSWAPAYNADGTIATDAFMRSSGSTNTLYSTKYNIDNNDVTRFFNNTRIDYEIIDNLTFSSSLGLDYTLRYYKNYGNRHAFGSESSNGSLTENSMRRFSYTTQNSLNYSFKLNEIHSFDITALQEFSKFKDRMLQGSGQNFPNDVIKNLSGASSNYFANSTYSDRMKMRFVGLVNYDFDKRYLINASYSYQGDSRFSNKYDSFYSLGLGWNMHEEDFLIDSEVIDEMRLKVGYGLTGNAGIGRNEYQTLLGYRTYDNGSAAYISGYGTNAEWEKSDRFDVSVDYGFFNRRLTGSIGVYFNKTKDMLFRVPLPLSAQYINSDEEAVVVRNAGEMTNKGFEFSLSADLIKTPDFNWNVGLNFATNDNEVSSVPADAEIISPYNVVQSGHKVHEWYMKEFAGIDPENGLPLWYIDRTQNDETTTNWNEAKRNYTGKNPLPTYTGSLSTRFDYKNLFLDATLFLSGGNQVYEQWARFQQATGQEQMMPYGSSEQAYYGAWREPGDVTVYPRFDRGNSSVASFSEDNSTRWLHDGTYMRLRHLGIGYTFKEGGILPLEKMGLNQMSLAIRGTNLWTWTKAKHLQYDPESRATGLLDLETPPIKTVTFNVNLKF